MSESLEFSACFWRCQQEEDRVSFHHDIYSCNICMQNVNKVTSLITNVTSSVDVNMQKHYFVSIDHLNEISVEVMRDCDQVCNLLPYSIDRDFCLSLNGSETLRTCLYCQDLCTFYGST